MALEGKTILITGSGGGLGLDTADMFLSSGANVLLCDINCPRVAAVRARYAVSHPRTAHVVEMNVADEESVRDTVSLAVRRFGRLDVVVNNAAVMDQFDPAGSCSKETWDRVLGVNLTGPFLVTKYAIKAMQRNQPVTTMEVDSEMKGSGLIINIGSNASHHGLSGGVAYTASKHGLIALTKNTAGFYGPKGIYCLALLVGGMETTNFSEAFTEGVNADGMRRMQDTQPGYRSIETGDVVRMIGFLANEGGRAANGSCMIVNGNWPES